MGECWGGSGWGDVGVGDGEWGDVGVGVVTQIFNFKKGSVVEVWNVFGI